MSGHHGHHHGGPGGSGPDRAANRRALELTLALTVTFTVVEAVGGVLTGSLALLADAGHMLSDDLSLALALGAIWLASRPATPQRSFGYQRAEILAALINGVALIAIAAWIVIEALGRLDDPPEVDGAPVMIVAAAGFAVNLIAFRILSRGSGESLNVAAAMRHVLADLAGSVGVLLAGFLILTTGWEQADPIIGGLIGLLVAASALPIIRDSVRVLLEQAPEGLDATEIGTTMAAAPGVKEVHDLHVWTITSGFPALSAHVLVAAGDDCHARRAELEALLAGSFGIEHTTLQVEHLPKEELLQVEGVGPKAPGGTNDG